MNRLHDIVDWVLICQICETKNYFIKNALKSFFLKTVHQVLKNITRYLFCTAYISKLLASNYYAWMDCCNSQYQGSFYVLRRSCGCLCLWVCVWVCLWVSMCLFVCASVCVGYALWSLTVNFMHRRIHGAIFSPLHINQSACYIKGHWHLTWKS